MCGGVRERRPGLGGAVQTLHQALREKKVPKDLELIPIEEERGVEEGGDGCRGEESRKWNGY